MRPRAPKGVPPVAILAPAIAALTGDPHTAAQLQRFQQYLDLLLAWNRTHRLTGIRSPEAIVRELFQGSLLFLARLPPEPLKRELGLSGVEIIEGRAEDVVDHRPDLSEGFEVAIARLVGVHLLPTAMRYLKPGGLFMASGPPAHRAATPPRGGTPAAWETVPFPALGISRTFLLCH